MEFRKLAVKLVAEVLLVCQDSLMACIELDVISWPSMLVLFTRQEDAELRTSLFVLVKNFLVGPGEVVGDCQLRCDPKVRKAFVEQGGFVFLANEVRKSSLSYEIVDAFFSVTFQEHVSIQNG